MSLVAQLSPSQITHVPLIVADILHRTLTDEEECYVFRTLADSSAAANSVALPARISAVIREIATALVVPTPNPNTNDAETFISAGAVSLAGEDTEAHVLSDERTHGANVDVRSLFDLPTLRALQLVLAPEMLEKKIYIVLDTLNAVNFKFDDISSTERTWDLVPNASFVAGAAAYKGSLTNIISMRITSIIVPTAFRRNPRFINLLVKELRTQSTILDERARTHFTFSAISYDAIAFNPQVRRNVSELRVANMGRYHFAMPISELTSITLSFGDATRSIPWPTAHSAIDLSTSGIQPPLLDVLIIEWLGFNDNITEIGDFVYILGYTTADPIADAELIAKVNGGPLLVVTDPNERGNHMDVYLGAVYNWSGATPGVAMAYNPTRRPIVTMQFTVMPDGG